MSRTQPVIVYRRGNLDDVRNFRLAHDLYLTPASIEFNIIGPGHEFWIATEGDEIIGLTVLSRTTATQHTILYLQVSGSYKSRGVGSGLINAVIGNYPEIEFVVVPFDGTEDFYRRLGFVGTQRWEMRRRPNPQERRQA